MVCGGLLLVFDARSPTTAGSTVTAPAGVAAGPAAGSAHTRATATAPDAAPDGVAVGFAGASGVLVQPVATSRASVSAVATVAPRRHLVIPTRLSPGT
ncbi:hypothetical protein GCM10010441_52490 [Kitasatospora paracochleata]